MRLQFIRFNSWSFGFGVVGFMSGTLGEMFMAWVLLHGMRIV